MQGNYLRGLFSNVSSSDGKSLLQKLFFHYALIIQLSIAFVFFPIKFTWFLQIVISPRKRENRFNQKMINDD